MKTIKQLTIVLILVGTALFANAKGTETEKESNIVSSADIKTSVQNLVDADFYKVNNYFYTNSINKVQSNVTVEFFISSNNEIKLMKAESEEGIAADYVKHLLNNAKLDIAKANPNKLYRIKINIDYKTF